MSFLEIVSKYRDAVRHVELSALLHDIDKADAEFKKDPKHHTLDKKTSDLPKKAQRWQNVFGDHDPAMPDCGIDETEISEGYGYRITIGSGRLSDAFCYHHVNNPAEKGTLMEFPLTAAVVHGGICGADGIDSGLNKVDTDDKKQKAGCYSKQTEPFEIATPFGKIDCYWDNGDFYRATRELTLNGAPIRDFREPFSTVLGETRKPYNDVTLWDHSFNVACWAKALFAKILIEYHSGIRQENGCYTLPGRSGVSCLKVELDREALLKQAHLAEDILGMNDSCGKIMDRIRDRFENELSIGNEIYRDHARMLFSFPNLTETLRADFETELKKALSEILAEAVAEFGLQQLPFAIAILPLETIPDPKHKNSIDAGKTFSQHSVRLLGNREHFFHALAPLTELNRSIRPGRVCDICRIRTAISGHDNDDHLCGVCMDRRKKFTSDAALPKLSGPDENKLAMFSISADLQDLRTGALFDRVYAKQEIHPLASPDRVYRSHETIRKFFSGFLAEIGKEDPCLTVTLSPESLDFILPAKSIDRVLSRFIRVRSETFDPFDIPFKTAVIAFHQNFPLYAVIDAAAGMKEYLSENGFDFLLLDAVEVRHTFTPQGRRHHIFGTANRYKTSDFSNFEKVWHYLSKLEKSQISSIENSLIAKRLDWGNEAARGEGYRAFANMVLFAPNALGKINCQGNEAFLLDSAVSGLMLDAIDLYIHIENKK